MDLDTKIPYKSPDFCPRRRIVLTLPLTFRVVVSSMRKNKMDGLYQQKCRSVTAGTVAS